jgi:hypothetical protein
MRALSVQRLFVPRLSVLRLSVPRLSVQAGHDAGWDCVSCRRSS